MVALWGLRSRTRCGTLPYVWGWCGGPGVEPSGPSSLSGCRHLHLVSTHHLTASAVLRVERESFHVTVRYAAFGLPGARPQEQDFPTFYRLRTDMPCRSGPPSCAAETKSIDFNHIYMALHPFTGGITNQLPYRSFPIKIAQNTSMQIHGSVIASPVFCSHTRRAESLAKVVLQVRFPMDYKADQQ